MRLRHIEIFYAVYRFGSISGAARDLNVSQPSVSKVLRHAEDQLGYALFDRIKGRLKPTEAAHELFSDVEDVYARLQVLDHTVKNIRTRKGGHIRLGVLPSLGLQVVPEAIARFRRDRPEVSFEIDILHSRDVARILFERQCDIAIGYGTPRGSHLVTRSLGKSELLLVTRPDSFRPRGSGVELAELHGKAFIGFRDSGPSGDIFTKQLSDHEVVPDEVVTARTYYVALSLVRLGVGLAVVDNFTTGSMMDETVAAYPFAKPIRYPVNAITLEDNSQPVLMTDFLETLAETVTSHSERWRD